MDLEKLAKANDLKNKIEKVESQIEKWEGANGIFNISLTKTANSWEVQTHDFNNIELYPIDFEVLKTLALKKLNNKLSELKTEFENL